MTSISAGGAQNAVNRIRTFWNSLPTYLPDELQLEVDPVVDQYDVAAGNLVSTLTVATPPATVSGSSTAVYGHGTGIRVDWNTGAILTRATVPPRSHRVRGRTYLVPAGSNVFDAGGGVAAAVQTAINTACATLVAGLITDGMKLVVWARPNNVLSYTGQTFDVTSGTVANKSAVLRRRRD